jgi:hypothetical protein
MINKSVHFNEWVNLTKEEFLVIVEGCKSLLDHMRCSNPLCGDYPNLSPRKGPAELLRCRCQTININLKAM